MLDYCTSSKRVLALLLAGIRSSRSNDKQAECYYRMCVCERKRIKNLENCNSVLEGKSMMPAHEMQVCAKVHIYLYRASKSDDLHLIS